MLHQVVLQSKTVTTNNLVLESNTYAWSDKLPESGHNPFCNHVDISFSLGIKHDADKTDKSTAWSFSTYMIAAGGGSQIKKIGTCTYVKQPVIHNYC